MTYAVNLPLSVMRRPYGPSPMNTLPSRPIQPVDEKGAGAFFDAAGVSISTGSAPLDFMIKWGFWLGMAAIMYKSYRILRYDEPFFLPSTGVPPAWEVNPYDEEWRRRLEGMGVEPPPPEYVVVNARYVSSTGDWYVQTEDGAWYWYDDRVTEWKHLPYGPTQANPGDEKDMLRVCAWCKRVWRDGGWRHVAIPEAVLQTHGICEECESKVYEVVDETDGVERVERFR